MEENVKVGLRKGNYPQSAVAFADELAGVVEKHQALVPAIEMVAVVAQILGTMLAYPTGFDIQTTFQVIMANMEEANRTAMPNLKPEGSA